MDLTNDPEKLQILKLFVSAHEFARPYAAPPDIPAERATALITAFEATTKEPLVSGQQLIAPDGAEFVGKAISLRPVENSERQRLRFAMPALRFDDE